MTRRIGTTSVLATVAGTALATMSSPALAAVTIGNGLQATPDLSPPSCGNVCTISQLELQAPFTAAGGLLASSDGVVVRWRIKVGADITPVALRVIRQPKVMIPAMTGAGTGPTVTPAPNQISTFEVRLPIHAGERVGIDCCSSTTHFAFAFHATGVDADVVADWNPALIDNALARSADVSSKGYQQLVNADIEPDADGDGFGDETQDQCPTIQGPCPVSPAASAAGQRAAALKKCKKAAKKKDWTKKRLRKCKKKANLLPV